MGPSFVYSKQLYLFFSFLYLWSYTGLHSFRSRVKTSVQFNSVTQSCPTLCDHMDCSTPGLPVHHQLPEFTQTHVHWGDDAIHTSHPLSSPSPGFNLSQHQGFFKWDSSSYKVAKVLNFQILHQCFKWRVRTDLLQGWTGWISLQSKTLSRDFSNTTVQMHQFFST